jgi:hypothetical protein
MFNGVDTMRTWGERPRVGGEHGRRGMNARRFRCLVHPRWARIARALPSTHGRDAQMYGVCNYNYINNIVSMAKQLLSPSHGVAFPLLDLCLTNKGPFICASSIQLGRGWDHFEPSRRTFCPRKDSDVPIPDKVEYNHGPRRMRGDCVIEFRREGSQLWQACPRYGRKVMVLIMITHLERIIPRRDHRTINHSRCKQKCSTNRNKSTSLVASCPTHNVRQ